MVNVRAMQNNLNTFNDKEREKAVARDLIVSAIKL